MGTDRQSEEDTGMSQEDILRWLGANPGWHKTLVVARGLGKRRHQVGPILTALAAHGEIKMRLLGNGPKAGLEWSI
jgi:hypothetical protein